MTRFRKFCVGVILFSFVVSGDMLGAQAKEIEYKTIKSAHFILKYETGVSAVYVGKLKTRAERYYRLITQEFGFVRDSAWVWDNRTKITILKDAQTYKTISGCYEWSAACVNYYEKEIYTFSGQDNFALTLKHELTHIIFREYVGFGVLPLWVDEGMAMYIQYLKTSKASKLIKMVKADIREEKFIPFDKIQKISNLKDKTIDVEKFYRQSYSMINYFIRKFGKYHFKEFLRAIKDKKTVEESMIKAFSLIDDIEDFERLWKRYYLK